MYEGSLNVICPEKLTTDAFTHDIAIAAYGFCTVELSWAKYQEIPSFSMIPLIISNSSLYPLLNGFSGLNDKIQEPDSYGRSKTEYN